MPRKNVRQQLDVVVAAAVDQSLTSRSVDTEMRTIPEFCSRNRIGKSTFYYLVALGRAPEITTIGGRKLISPEDEAAWRRSIKENPLPSALRPAAQAALAEEAA
ncbi:hypothetical protein [Methylobacterium nonmethylotrophicum]|uniref:Helix-turn-helix domain-containing protein n=1 Tax=Methylobacterium nonmethylotrophicum TaxID=1141884 RepID=A0A4Z0NHH8_9HYPH|nr:hypothetical protein [Methylobacterium nonmethylotrophicum]TGD94904.1 hypothetical protein EU555_30485 [Methylobacterium nonmethylotrophicum]